MLDYIIIALSVIYGLLNILAGSIQIKERKIPLWSIITMIFGGLLIGLGAIFIYVIDFYFFYVFITGLVLIHISTIFNGLKMYGKINPKHHIIRLIFSLILIVLFIIL